MTNAGGALALLAPLEAERQRVEEEIDEVTERLESVKMVTNSAEKSTRGQSLYPDDIPAYVSFVFGLLAAACEGYGHLYETAPNLTFEAIGLALISLACACYYLVSLRKVFNGYKTQRTYVTNREQKREIAWAVIATCVGLVFSIMTFVCAFT